MKYLWAIFFLVLLIACQPKAVTQDYFEEPEPFEPTVSASAEEACPNGLAKPLTHDGQHLTRMEDVLEQVFSAPYSPGLAQNVMERQGVFLLEDGFYRCSRVDEKIVIMKPGFSILSYKITNEGFDFTFQNSVGQDVTDTKVIIRNDECTDLVELGNLAHNEERTVFLRCPAEEVLEAEVGFVYHVDGKLESALATVKGLVRE